MSNADARKWPAWVLMPRHRREKPESWQPHNEAEAHLLDTYIHRDAARAWAGLWAWLSFTNDRFLIDDAVFSGPAVNPLVFTGTATVNDSNDLLDIRDAAVMWPRREARDE